MRKVVAFLLLFALLAAACGADGDTDSTAAALDSATAGPAIEPAEEPTLPAAEPNPAATMADETSVVGVVLAPSAGLERAESDATAPVAELVTGLNDAGFGLWQTQPADGNFVFSPMSIGHTLLMARAAADEPTGAAIDEALGLPPGLAAHEAWNAVDLAMADAASSQEELTISIADAIFPRLDVNPSQEWVDTLAAQHGAGIESLDFAGDPDGSKGRINQWVGDQTRGLIPDLLPDGFIEPSTVLVLADAVYFKAQWQNVFGKYGPVNDAFTRLDGTTVPVEFMQELELPSKRGVGDGFAAAEVPYIGGQFSMLVIIPDQGSFEDFRDGLDSARIAEIDAALTTGPFELWLPKWETNSELDLGQWLTDIGASPGSYPDITPGAFLEAGVHAADIAVDEQGTVAAAATALGFEEEGPPEPEVEIKADQPFLYLIRHRPSGLILFAGQVTDPT